MKRLPIIGLVLVIITAAALWWFWRQNAAQTFTMPDGTRLYFRGATIGKSARMDFSSPVEKILGHLPERLGRKFRRNVWRDESKEETLAFWFELERMPAANSLVTVEFKDAKQHRAFQATAWLPAQRLGNGRIVTMCSFPDWPKWDKALAVRIGQSDGNKPDDAEGDFIELGELTVKNPAP